MTEAKFWHHSLLALVYNGFLQFLKVSPDFGNICMVRASHREPILSLPLPIANDMDKMPIIELTHTSEGVGSISTLVLCVGLWFDGLSIRNLHQNVSPQRLVVLASAIFN